VQNFNHSGEINKGWLNRALSDFFLVVTVAQSGAGSVGQSWSGTVGQGWSGSIGQSWSGGNGFNNRSGVGHYWGGSFNDWGSSDNWDSSLRDFVSVLVRGGNWYSGLNSHGSSDMGNWGGGNVGNWGGGNVGNWGSGQNWGRISQTE
ncbi:hypothetical protein, partial [Staphylococcus aureus]|uniref:hypothetical protein n=1 Tax=Staphylococcus aureus TaxID=1280 RepID=UPI0038B36D6C